MNRRDRALYHQIHPVKLATDLSSAVISLWLLWQHRLALALIVMFVPAIIASAVLIKYGRLEDLAAS